MKTRLHFHYLFVVLTLFAGVHQAASQGTQFFRISGPAATTITAFNGDGTLVWSNALAGTNYTVQTVTSLPGGTNWVNYVQLPVTQAVNTNLLVAFNPPAGMALIPAGSFTMGDALGDGASWELPLHTVYVSAFYMDKYDVTKALWDDVYNWAVTNGYSFDYGAAGKASNHPAQYVTWYDAVKWCNARSEKEGRTPAYYTSAGQTMVYRTGQTNVQNDWVKWNNGYRLPTEAEWEKAARGGLSGQRYPWGNIISESLANYHGNPGYYAFDLGPDGLNINFTSGGYPYTSPAGYFAPNGYGLYDMAGNVWQCCWDWYGSYSSGSQTDPHGPTSGPYRIIRGGSFFSNAIGCSTAARTGTEPPYESSELGFRTVLSPAQ